MICRRRSHSAQHDTRQAACAPARSALAGSRRGDTPLRRDWACQARGSKTSRTPRSPSFRRGNNRLLTQLLFLALLPHHAIISKLISMQIVQPFCSSHQIDLYFWISSHPRRLPSAALPLVCGPAPAAMCPAPRAGLTPAGGAQGARAGSIPCHPRQGAGAGARRGEQ